MQYERQAELAKNRALQLVQQLGADWTPSVRPGPDGAARVIVEHAEQRLTLVTQWHTTIFRAEYTSLKTVVDHRAREEATQEEAWAELRLCLVAHEQNLQARAADVRRAIERIPKGRQ